MLTGLVAMRQGRLGRVLRGNPFGLCYSADLAYVICNSARTTVQGLPALVFASLRGPAVYKPMQGLLGLQGRLHLRPLPTALRMYSWHE